MSGKRFFLDTSYVIALLNPDDQLHAAACAKFASLQDAREVWSTELVLVEIADSLSASNRSAAVEFIWNLRRSQNVRVVKTDTELLDRGLAFYEARPDKTWGLTDCISFLVMSDRGLKEALTGDRHFTQAGLRALLLEEPPP